MRSSLRRRGPSHLLTEIARGGNRSVWKRLADQWALVTGASTGLGAEFARQLAARGMHLVMVARRQELMAEIAQDLHTKHGTRCEIIIADLSIPDEPRRILDEISSKGIVIELLINNAGFGVVGEVDNADSFEHFLVDRTDVSTVTRNAGTRSRRHTECVVAVRIPACCLYGGLRSQQGIRPAFQ